MKKGYFKFFSLFAVSLLFGSTAIGQITYNESFTSGLNGWSNNWAGTNIETCDGQSARSNIYDVGSAGEFTSPNLGNHAGSALAVSFDYKVVDWADPSNPTPNFGEIDVQWSTSVSGPWTTVYNINSGNHVPSASCANVAVPEFCASAGDFYLRFNATFVAGDYYMYFDNVDIVPGTPQCGAPSGLSASNIDNVSATFEWASGCGETGWNFEFGEENFTPGTGTEIFASSVTAPSETVTGLTQVTTYDAYVQADCGSAWLGPVSITTLPNCSAPSGLSVVVISPDSVSLSWSAGSTGETEWTIEYGETGFTSGTGTYVSVMTNPYDTLTGLMQNTTYDFYILGNCSLTDSSLWVGPETATTPLFCNNVFGLSASTVIDTAFLSWSAGSNAETMWNVEYGPEGFELGSGMSYATANNNTDTLVGLNGGANYDYYVQAACASGDTSLFTGPFSFTMPITNDDACDAIKLEVDNITRSFTTVGSTTQGVLSGENKSTWFYFVHPVADGAKVSLCGSSFDTKLFAYTRTDCADFSTYDEIAYNDDECAASSEFEICGTAGDTLFVMVTGFGGNTVGDFVITISEISLNAGTSAAMSICNLDTTDLYSVITDSDSSGVWTFDLNPNTLVNGDEFDASSVPLGVHQVVYIVAATCAADTSVATINVVAPAESGIAVSPFTTCNSGDVFLPNGLTGTMDIGGVWSDDSNTGMLGGANGNVFYAFDLPVGSYPFTYTVSNGICPDASTSVSVTLTTCTSVDENSLSFSIYPNPNEGVFNITSNISEEVSISIMDVQGKVVYNNKVSIVGGTPQVITLDNVDTGMYILKIAAESNVSTQSFIVR